MGSHAVGVERPNFTPVGTALRLSQDFTGAKRRSFASYYGPFGIVRKKREHPVAMAASVRRQTVWKIQVSARPQRREEVSKERIPTSAMLEKPRRYWFYRRLPVFEANTGQATG